MLAKTRNIAQTAARSLAKQPLFARIVAYLALALTGLRYTGGVYAWISENRLEQPTYTVVETLPGGVEVRRYDAITIAETTIEGSLREATSSGFRLCAGYIFGKNKPRNAGLLAPAGAGEKMAMTAPVRQAVQSGRGGGKKVKISFVMSRKRPLNSLPIPRDAKVRLRTLAPHYAAFKKFNGPPPTDKTVAKAEAAVRAALERTGGKVRPVANAETLVLGYHDPFAVPNLLRRNEVGLMVEGKALRPL
jgi:hypothetical protein